jgi:hypothetical protein
MVMLTKRGRRLALLAACGIASGAWAQYFDSKKYGENYEEEKAWVEAQAPLPEYPKPDNLMEFYVSAATANKFFVDAKSLSVGADGVVRYTVVVRAPGGANNVSFEGIRCQTRERRLYAFGRADGTWAGARGKEWVGIRPGGPSGYQAVLSKEYFCPGGTPIYRAEEGVEALRRGGHPQAR